MAWHKLITHNLGWKIVSVILATVLWWLISVGGASTLRFGQGKTFDAVPIQVLMPAGNPGAFQLDPSSVGLTVAGTSEALRRLRLTDVLVFVNLANIQEVEAYREVEVHLPPGVVVNKLVPNQVRVIRVDPRAPNPSLPDP